MIHLDPATQAPGNFIAVALDKRQRATAYGAKTADANMN